MTALILPILSDMVIIIFDLILYSRMIPMRWENRTAKIIRTAGCMVITVVYVVAVYKYRYPASIASAAIMTVPSFILFWIFSKYRDCRFILSFCLIDTATLILACISRYTGLMIHGGEVLSLVIVIMLCLGMTLLSGKFCKSYYELMEVTNNGWGSMAVATVLIYAAIIFFSAYPKPLIERLEYAPAWLMFAAVVVSCYVVFVNSIRKTKQICEQNERLKREREYFHMAYTDALTGLPNRAACVERINEIERSRNTHIPICAIMLDMNNFKKINDGMGHYKGDQALRCMAEVLKTVFHQEKEYVFRASGDEFIAIVLEQTEEQIQQKLELMQQKVMESGAEFQNMISVAWGYEFLQADEEDTLEKAFIRADTYMYKNKKQMKENLQEESRGLRRRQDG